RSLRWPVCLGFLQQSHDLVDARASTQRVDDVVNGFLVLGEQFFELCSHVVDAAAVLSLREAGRGYCGAEGPQTDGLVLLNGPASSPGYTSILSRRYPRTGEAVSQTKILLDESDIPTRWYNVVADMPNPPTPPLGPDGKPVHPDALTAIFP